MEEADSMAMTMAIAAAAAFLVSLPVLYRLLFASGAGGDKTTSIRKALRSPAPARFQDPSAVPPYGFVPFGGGGARVCPGNEFAKVESGDAGGRATTSSRARFRWKLAGGVRRQLLQVVDHAIPGSIRASSSTSSLSIKGTQHKHLPLPVKFSSVQVNRPRTKSMQQTAC